MPLQPGAHLGPYEILSTLGAGGMGEVYRARDTRLNRNVAIKVLPDLFANDPERLARFKREAQVLAALNHPNIAHIHGMEDSGGIPALIMELVDGPTLAERIAQGRIPLPEALPVAKQMAEALEAAHDLGIIHRDLKPANVKVREDGTVKVLDFGLAKLTDAGEAGSARAAAGAAGLTASPTITSPAMMTGVGIILGTAAYMAPEQAKGRSADKRSDVWAFGAVLFEMLTGRRAFEGEDLSDTLATVLKSEPDWTTLPAEVPPHVRTLVQRCLVKDRRHRIADISTALFVINESASLGSGAPPAIAQPVSASPRPPSWRRLVMPTAAVLGAAAVVGTAVWLAMRPGPARVTRFALTPTGAATLLVDSQSRDLAVTPDGTHIVYKGAGAGGGQLFVRAVDQLEPTPLVGAGLLPRAPFLSPNGQWIGFIEPGAGVSLRKVAITGGPTTRLCLLDGPSRGATWGDDDSIIFATAALSTGLQRVSAAGGDVTVLTKPNLERGESDHLYPQFLPGGHEVLFTITSTAGGTDASQVAVLDLRTLTQTIVLRGGSQASYVPSGHLVYAAAGTLRAVAFSLERLKITGPSIPVLSEVTTLPNGTAEFDIAQDGTLVYVAGVSGMAPARTLVWVDRQGHEEAVKSAPTRTYASPRLSPDGMRVALEIRDQENDIWVWDFARETLRRLTFDPGIERAPVWTPDGLRLVFSSGTPGALFWQAADGRGAAERLTHSPAMEIPSAVSRDGTRVVFSTSAAATGIDVMMLTLDKDRRVQPLVHAPSPEMNGDISPDGRWLAYESNDSRQSQILVRPFPNVETGLWLVSAAGGTQPLWVKNGQDLELVYLAPDGAIMSVPVERSAGWTAGKPTRLMDGHYYRGTGITGRTYDVSPDGKRFLMIKDAVGRDQAPSAPSIVVVQNWLEELKRLVPAAR